MTTCINCNGEGLAGQGDQPWLKQGLVVTCPKCAGTGKVPEEITQTEAEAPVNTEDATPADNAPVDNANLSEGSPEDQSGASADTSAPGDQTVAEAVDAPSQE